MLLINPYYFVLLMAGFFTLNVCHVVSLDQEWSFSLTYFLAYALLQSFLEVILLGLVAHLIKRYFPNPFYYGFISLCLLFFILRYIDFTLTRFMDISVFYGLRWVFDESFENFIELLHLTGISIMTWAFLLAATVTVIPLLAVGLYKLTAKLATKKPLKVTYRGLAQVLCCLPLGLIALDFTVTPRLDRQQYYYYERVLPWKSTLFSQEKVLLRLGRPLKSLPNENKTLKILHTTPIAAANKPNIYLFIVESLRDDFMTEETAPHIATFREENVRFGKTFSNANATHKAWYSLFYSRYPFLWAETQKKWESGSPPLQILKKMGYDIHVYSGSQLRYYRLDKLMFGTHHYLADSYHVYPHYAPVQAWESDTRAVNKFLGHLDKEKSKEGNLFIFFIDSTHFNYSWPDDYPTHFTPISEEKTDLRVSNSIKNVHLTKNRYRNSIHFVDSLFGQVVNRLKEKGLYDDALILFTADHGEEFFEEGQLFHASHLSAMQTEPPLYMKLGDNKRLKTVKTDEIITSHVDIFPTLIDYLLGEQPYPFFDGESLFKEGRFPFVITGRFNGPRAPEEFFIHDGTLKCTLRFNTDRELEVRSLKNTLGRPLKINKEALKARYAPVFKKIINN
ncbi:sulfatase-like hydrolase/transferase [Candidatus Neptunochlamydia vexilliferae]|uniref:sulfatase-like hydrolase/transferase n=1 Tax=Candidatus Neptunichlamydia vexilliferae TaxID=1651774 RepID=UPI00189122C1|nr:sulfatase-like hydrolase/transferase [Candidatus Neptunochlamydia vexilliferae]